MEVVVWGVLIFFFVMAGSALIWTGKRLAKAMKALEEPKHDHIWTPWTQVEDRPYDQERQCLSCEFKEFHTTGHVHEWDKWEPLQINYVSRTTGRKEYSVSGQRHRCLTCGLTESREVS